MRLCALSPLFPLSHLLPSLAPRSFTPRFPISSDSTRVPSSSAPRFNYSHAAPVFLSACVTNTTQTPLVRVHEQLSLAGQRAVLTSLSGFRWVLSTAQQPSRVSCCPRHLPAASPHPHPLPFLTGSLHSPSQASLSSLPAPLQARPALCTQALGPTLSCTRNLFLYFCPFIPAAVSPPLLSLIISI